MRERNKNVPQGSDYPPEIPSAGKDAARKRNSSREGAPRAALSRSQGDALQEVGFHRDYRAHRRVHYTLTRSLPRPAYSSPASLT